MTTERTVFLAIVILAIGCGDDLPGASDASPPDAARQPDAGSTPIDAASARDETACDDDLAGTLVCDGFEDSALAPWFLNLIDGTLEPSNSTVFRGTAALRAQMNAISGTASAERFLDPPLDSGNFHVRAYYYIPSGDFDYLQLFKFLEDDGAFLGINVAVGGDAVALLQTLEEEPAVASQAFPLDEWFCLQLNVTVDASAGSAELLVNGTQLLNLTGIATLPPTAGYSIFGVGVEFTTPAQPITNVFVDEVVLDTSPVACESN